MSKIIKEKSGKHNIVVEFESLLDKFEQDEAEYWILTEIIELHGKHFELVNYMDLPIYDCQQNFLCNCENCFNPFLEYAEIAEKFGFEQHEQNHFDLPLE